MTLAEHKKQLLLEFLARQYFHRSTKLKIVRQTPHYITVFVPDTLHWLLWGIWFSSNYDGRTIRPHRILLTADKITVKFALTDIP